MIVRAALAIVVVLGVGPVPPAPPKPAPAGPLTLAPSIARVRIEIGRERALVIEDVSLARGQWQNGDVDFYAAYGAPGVPIALDARLIPVADGALESGDDEHGEPIDLERAPRRPVSAQALLGRPQMAGAVLHARGDQLSRALAPANMATLRVRAVHALPADDAAAGRELVVRLGIAGASALVLGRLQLSGRDGVVVTRAEARLCGPEADARPLAIAIAPKPTPASAPAADRPLAPVLAARHATDDLCVRFWTR